MCGGVEEFLVEGGEWWYIREKEEERERRKEEGRKRKIKCGDQGITAKDIKWIGQNQKSSRFERKDGKREGR